MCLPKHSQQPRQKDSKPQLQHLDNKASELLRSYLAAKTVDYQLVPPGIHCRNYAEHAIRTFRNHFMEGICFTDPDLPLHLWYHLLPQALLTLNLLQVSHVNPRLSYYSQLHSAFDFNQTLLAPSVICAVVHKNPDSRNTWSPHGVNV